MLRTNEYQTSRYGLTIDDFSKIPATPEFGDELLVALAGVDPKARRLALFFCEGFSKYSKLHSLGENFVESLPRILLRLLEDHDELTKEAAFPLLVQLRAQFPNYRQTMLKALVDASSSVRTIALNVSDTFLKPGEIDPLLSFEHDPYLSEIAPGGPIHYVLRNQSLTKIELMVKKQFTKHELTEMIEGEVVFWWDWQPMLSWLKAH